MRCGKHRINTNGQIRLMFRLGGLRMSGKAVWINAWWYGAYRCTVLVVTCCSAVVKVNSDREPYLSRSSSTVHTERSKLQGWGPDRSSEPQTPDPTRPSRTWKVTCHKHKCQSAAGHHREVKHRCHPWLLLFWIWRQRRFLTFILIKSVQINVSFMFNLGTIIN